MFLQTPSSGSSVGEFFTIKDQKWFLENEEACSKACSSTGEGLWINKLFFQSAYPKRICSIIQQKWNPVAITFLC